MWDIGLRDSLLDPLQHRSRNQRQTYGRVQQHFGKAAAFFGRNELAPGYGFAVGAARQSAPVHRLGTDAHSVVKALQRQLFPAPAMTQLDERPKLLRPIPGHAAADGEDAQPLLLQQRFRVVFQILKRIVMQRRNAILAARSGYAAPRPVQSRSR